MAFDFKAALKKKWVKVALAGIAFVSVFLIIRSRSASGSSSSGATSSTGLDDAQAADVTSLEEQQNQIQAASAAQSASIAAQESEQSESDQTGLTAQANNNQTQIALAGIQLTGLQDQLTAQTTQNQDTLNAQVSLANIAANEQTSIAQTNANENMADTAVTAGEQVAIAGQEASVEGLISNNQTNVALAQNKGGGGGGCFVTTAVCQYSGEADDCPTLETLRNFRDLYMLATPQRAAFVDLYYATAPVIVERIDSFHDAARAEIYGVLRAYVDLAVAFIRAGDDSRAAGVYVDMLAFASQVAA
jgi:hypothetical protein